MCTDAWEFCCFGSLYWNGLRTWEDQDGRLRYFDDDAFVEDDPERACPVCRSWKNVEGHDACLDTVAGVRFACCGHGMPEMAYVKFKDDRTIRGYHALLHFSRQGHAVGYPWVIRIEDRAPWWQYLESWRRRRAIGGYHAIPASPMKGGPKP